MNALFLNLALHFIVHELGNLGTSVDWTKIKTDYDAKLKTMLPAFWQGDIIALVNGLVDAVALACKDEADLTAVLEKITAKDWSGAIEALKGLLAKLPLGSFVVTLLAA